MALIPGPGGNPSGGGTPPSGPAGGDLSGTYPNPSVVHFTLGALSSANGFEIVHVGAPLAGDSAARLEDIPTSLPPNGAAGGDLAGTYPNPTLNPSTGTGGTYGQTDAVTNASRTILRLQHLLSAGAAAVGFGAGLAFALPNAAGTLADQYVIQGEWENPTAGSETSRLTFYGRSFGSALTAVVRMHGNGLLQLGAASIGATAFPGVRIVNGAGYQINDSSGGAHPLVTLSGTNVAILGDNTSNTTIPTRVQGTTITVQPLQQTGTNVAGFAVTTRGGGGTGNAAAQYASLGGSVASATSGTTAQATADAARGYGQVLQLLVGLSRPRRTVADANTTATVTDQRIAYTSLTAARVVAGPTTASLALLPAGTQLEYRITDESGSASLVNTLTFTPAAGTINGAASAVVVNSAFGSAVVYWDGTNWHAVPA
jgi:hypothetical protein